MHLLPLLLALASVPVRAGETHQPDQAKPASPPPAACKAIFPPGVWETMPAWQRFYVLTELNEKKLPCAKVQADLKNETEMRLDTALDKLYVQMRHYQERRAKGEDMSVGEREKFAHDALNLNNEYPGAKVLANRQAQLDEVRETGARWELEAEYILSHPTDAKFAAGLKAIRDSKQTDKAGLDALFDGTKGAGAPTANAGPVRLPPAGARPVAGQPGAKTGPVAPAHPPHIRFEAEPPTDPIRKEIWLKAGGPDKEKAFFITVMAGLQTETERAVLTRLGENQAAWEAKHAAEIASIDQQLRDMESGLKRVQMQKGSDVQVRAFQSAVAELRRERETAGKKTSEVLVSMSDLDGNAGEAQWDVTPSADGKIHLHARFKREYVSVPKAETYMMKVFTHEFSHNADQAHPDGMIRGLTERVAYLNGAKAYKEEGEPTNTWQLESEGRIFQAIKRDPVEWTVAHLTAPAYIEKGNLMAYIMSDDIKNPDAGFRWRMRLAYDYAARLKKTDPKKIDPKKPGPKRTPAEELKESLADLRLGDDILNEMVAVRLDDSILGSDKSEVFAQRAAATRSGKYWIVVTREMSTNEKSRIFKDQVAYWKDLGAFYLQP